MGPRWQPTCGSTRQWWIAAVRPSRVWISGYRIPLLEVTAVTPETRGRTVVLLLDDSATPAPEVPRLREAARRFVELVQSGDRLAVATLHGGSVELTDNRAQLLQELDTFRVRGFPFRPEDAGTRVLRRLTAISRGLAEKGPGRNVVVGIGAGWLYDAPLLPHAAVDQRAAWIEAMRAAAAAHVSLYVVDPAGVGSASGRFGGASGFARETGGHAFMHTNDLRDAAARIWREAGTYYLLGVRNPPMQRTADLREVDVRIRRDGATVRARRHVPGRMAGEPGAASVLR
jgi:VWFA-related protein